MMQKATQQQTKEHNTNLVLKNIFDHESISRAEIARITSLTRTTVSEIVAELIAEGLVEEIGMGSSLGGKSPILLSLVDDSRTLIGLDLARNKFSGAIVNLRGEIRQMVEHEINGFDGNAALASVYEILDELVHTSNRPLVGIGIGTPGIVNANEGVVVNAVNLDWKDLPLAQLIQERYHLPVSVINDSQAAAMGEYTFGKGHQPEGSLIAINVRYGVGAGIIIHGQLFHGDGGGAGEIGHVVVVREGGLLCRCGNHGCLETVASAQAVVQRAQMLIGHTISSSLAGAPENITLDSIEQAFTAGDPLARQVILEAGGYLGMAISNMVGALNIHKVVLAGDMTRFGKPWLDAIQDTMRQTTLARLADETQIEFGQMGRNGIILGASALILKDYSLLFTGNQHLVSLDN
jgi:glucokinase-like ROK family protein